MRSSRPLTALFLARELGEGLGYLFEHKFVGGFYGEFLGEDYTPYKFRFAAQTHRMESDYTLYAPIRELFREVNQDVDSVWRERVSWLVDLNQVITHVAIETFLAEFDGFLGGSGMANFYLYRPVATNVHRLIAWDRDTTFQDIESPIFARAEDNALISRALRFRDLRTLYLDVLEQCARAAAQDRWLEAEIYQAHQLIRDAAYEDGAKRWTNEEYELVDRAPDVIRPAASRIGTGRSRQSSMRPSAIAVCRASSRPPRAHRISNCLWRPGRTTSQCWWAPEILPSAAPAARWRPVGCSMGRPERYSLPATLRIQTGRRSSSRIATSPRGAATKIARGRRRVTTNTARRAPRRTSRTLARMPVPQAAVTTCTARARGRCSH